MDPRLKTIYTPWGPLCYLTVPSGEDCQGFLAAEGCCTKEIWIISPTGRSGWSSCVPVGVSFKLGTECHLEHFPGLLGPYHMYVMFIGSKLGPCWVWSPGLFLKVGWCCGWMTHNSMPIFASWTVCGLFRFSFPGLPNSKLIGCWLQAFYFNAVWW